MHPTGRALRGRQLRALAGPRLTVACVVVAGLMSAWSAVAPAAAGAAAARRDCGGVSHSSGGPAGGIAFNQVVAINVSCAAAKSLALAFLTPKKNLPPGWSKRSAVVEVKGNSETYEYFTKGTQTVIGEDEAG